MEAPRILIVYGTRYGQTARIVQRIARVLTTQGCDVTTVRGDAPGPGLGLDAYDGLVVGASLIAGHYQRYVERWIRRHSNALPGLPSLFVAVSGSAASADPEERVQAGAIMETFLAKVGWRPDATASVGGAIAYTRYNPLLRWMMKRISAKEGGPTDTSRDHELTDWDQVEGIARAFGARVGAPGHPREAAMV